MCVNFLYSVPLFRKLLFCSYTILFILQIKQKILVQKNIGHKVNKYFYVVIIGYII